MPPRPPQRSICASQKHLAASLFNINRVHHTIGQQAIQGPASSLRDSGPRLSQALQVSIAPDTSHRRDLKSECQRACIRVYVLRSAGRPQSAVPLVVLVLVEAEAEGRGECGSGQEVPRGEGRQV